MHFVGPTVFFIYLINDNDWFQIKLQCFLQNESCLWHRTFKCINKQTNTIGHFQNTFNFATKVGVTRCVNNINLYAFIFYRCVFRKNGNASFTFQIIAIHDELTGFLVFAEDLGSMQDFVDQCCFTMVNVSNDGDVSDIHKFFLLKGIEDNRL